MLNPGRAPALPLISTTMKVFTQHDINTSGSSPCIYADPASDLHTDPLPWQLAGRSFTATGYGSRIPTTYKLNLAGKLYRVYATCYGNAASTWIMIKGNKIIIN
jgi:hypothetical protein